MIVANDAAIDELKESLRQREEMVNACGKALEEQESVTSQLRRTWQEQGVDAQRLKQTIKVLECMRTAHSATTPCHNHLRLGSAMDLVRVSDEMCELKKTDGDPLSPQSVIPSLRTESTTLASPCCLLRRRMAEASQLAAMIDRDYTERSEIKAQQRARLKQWQQSADGIRNAWLEIHSHMEWYTMMRDGRMVERNLPEGPQGPEIKAQHARPTPGAWRSPARSADEILDAWLEIHEEWS